MTTASPFPWPEERIAHYTAYRAAAPLTIDGRLDEPSWQMAPRSRRFVDLISGRPTVHDTRAAVLWDDDCLYVGFWVEEPFVEAKLTERDATIWSENDVEVFVAGQDAYYELELNALGTIYEALFVWEDAYEAKGYDRMPELARTVEGFRPWNGVGFDRHPRGQRLGFFRWDLPGLRARGVSRRDHQRQLRPRPRLDGGDRHPLERHGGAGAGRRPRPAAARRRRVAHGFLPLQHLPRGKTG